MFSFCHNFPPDFRDLYDQTSQCFSIFFIFYFCVEGASGLWPGSRERSSDEFEREAEEEVIEDHPPPTYDQSINYNTAGTCEGVNVMIQGGPGSDNMEPPPSYQEWTRKAASLRNQEIGRGGIGLVTISDNFPVPSHDASENVESEDQC